MLNQVVLVGKLKYVIPLASDERLILLSIEVLDPSGISYRIPVVASSLTYSDKFFAGGYDNAIGVKGYLFVKNSVLHVRADKINLLGRSTK